MPAIWKSWSMCIEAIPTIESPANWAWTAARFYAGAWQASSRSGRMFLAHGRLIASLLIFNSDGRRDAVTARSSGRNCVSKGSQEVWTWYESGYVAAMASSPVARANGERNPVAMAAAERARPASPPVGRSLPSDTGTRR